MHRQTDNRPRRRGAALMLALVLSSGLAACGTGDTAHYVAEEPAGSEQWVEIEDEPAWVTEIPQRDGYLRFVATGKSNLRSIIATGDRPSATRDAVLFVAARLTPVVGVGEATQIANSGANALELVRRACREEVLTTDPVPGNTLCTAWALWEVPIADVIVDVQGPLREAAHSALAR